jgi:hypothetical protein
MPSHTRPWAARITTGWVALSVGAFVPFVVALYSWLQTRDLHCTDVFEYSVAPLLATCGVRSSGVLTLGWVLTTLTVGGIVVAAITATLALLSSRQTEAAARPEHERQQARILGITTVLVVATGIIARLTMPDSVGRNGWLLPASGLAVLMVFAMGIVALVLGLSLCPVDPRDGTHLIEPRA